jgi:hypothetical protein
VRKKIKNILIFFGYFFSLMGLLTPAEYLFDKNLDIQPLNYSLRIFTLDNHGNIIGRTAEKGNLLYKVVEKGHALELLSTFPEQIVGIHVMTGGRIIVSTDMDHWNPRTPCRVYLSEDRCQTFGIIKTLPHSGAIWWSMASDSRGNLYVGEYGPKEKSRSKRVWKSPDLGKTWEVIFTAPDVDDVHIHLVKTDPYTGDLWVTHGDARDGVYVSRNQGRTWTLITRSQPTAMVFGKVKIYFGEDKPHRGAVSVYDRATGKYLKNIFKCTKYGNYAGPVYDMTLGSNNILYVPFMKYPFLKHRPSLWIGDGKQWNLIMECVDANGRFEGFENIAGPDKFGYIYTKGYRLKDFSSLPLKSPLPLTPPDNAVIVPGKTTLTWSPGTGASHYRLVLAEDEEFETLFLKKTVASHYVTVSLPGGKRFFWRVKSLKTHLFTTSWSPVRGFETTKRKK